MWSNDILIKVYANVKEELKDKYPNVYFTTTIRAPAKPKFPTVVFRQLQGSEISPDIYGDTINIIQSNIQIDVIANDNQETSDMLSDEIMNVMKLMCYQVVGTPYIDESDVDTFRTITRYRANIGNGNRLF